MIQFKKLHPDAKLPTRATPGSAGFDLYTMGTWHFFAGERRLIGTRCAAAIPPGWCGQIWPRSGLSAKKGIDRMAGLIDSDFRGEIMVLLVNHSDNYVEINPGDRIAQLVVVPCLVDSVEVEELDSTSRGESGFGSSGK